jgi:hypothetical protein
MNKKQEEKMIKAAHKYWVDESGSYDKEEIMVDSFIEGYKQAFALYNVVGRSKQLGCKFCGADEGLIHGYMPDGEPCPMDKTA